jgi:hypothetical protein
MEADPNPRIVLLNKGKDDGCPELWQLKINEVPILLTISEPLVSLTIKYITVAVSITQSV